MPATAYRCQNLCKVTYSSAAETRTLLGSILRGQGSTKLGAVLGCGPLRRGGYRRHARGERGGAVLQAPRGRRRVLPAGQDRERPAGRERRRGRRPQGDPAPHAALRPGLREGRRRGDVGTAIKGRVIDLWFPTTGDAREWVARKASSRFTAKALLRSPTAEAPNLGR